MLHAGLERKREERLHLQRDVEDLTDGGKWLSEEDRATLTKRIEEYFSADNRLQGCPGKQLTMRDALTYQAHLLLHLLNDNIIPVPRTEIFCSLQIGMSFDWDFPKQQFVLEFKGGAQAEATKTRTAMKVWVPKEATMKFRAWVKFFRPVLVNQTLKIGGDDGGDGQGDGGAGAPSSAAGASPAPPAVLPLGVKPKKPWTHMYLFVKKDGTGPRTEILTATVGLQKLYLDGRSATPHRFRSMQATDSVQAGISNAEHRAMCAGRQHTTAAAERFYVKQHRRLNAELAEGHLERLREAKRTSDDGDGECGDGGDASDASTGDEEGAGRVVVRGGRLGGGTGEGDDDEGHMHPPPSKRARTEKSKKHKKQTKKKGTKGASGGVRMRGGKSGASGRGAARATAESASDRVTGAWEAPAPPPPRGSAYKSKATSKGKARPEAPSPVVRSLQATFATMSPAPPPAPPSLTDLVDFGE